MCRRQLSSESFGLHSFAKADHSLFGYYAATLWPCSERALFNKSPCFNERRIINMSNELTRRKYYLIPHNFREKRSQIQ